MDVKIRNKDEIDAFGDHEFKAELVQIYEIDTEVLVSYIKQSIEILLIMKDEEYQDQLTALNKKIQQLKHTLSQK